MTGRWQCDLPAGIDSVHWVEAPPGTPGPGEALVAIEAASLNFPDLLTLSGKYQQRPELPFVPGTEFAGKILSLGPGTEGVDVGDPVMTAGGNGGFATHACVAVSRLKPVPEGVSPAAASVLLVAYGTAWLGLMDRAALQAGETVLVLGASGGVGTAAIQVAKAAGARVIAAVSSEDKAAFCRGLGADATLDYSRGELRAALHLLVPGGPDVVFDPVGDELTEQAFRSIAWRGRYLVVGFAAGAIPRLPLNLPLLKGASIIGVIWGQFDAREPAASRALVANLAMGHAAGWLRPSIDRVMPMRDLPAALSLMAARAVRGKLVLVNETA